MTDSFGREITYLRLSVTDLCSFRCVYCMPPEGVRKRPHGEILSLEELAEIAEAAVRLGIKKIRLTGGEPLVRPGIVSLVEKLAGLPGLEDLTMTTNGSLLPRYALPLKQAGLNRLNVSLDTLDPNRFREITRTGELSDVLAGLDAAAAAGFTNTKINAVLLGGFNDDGLRPLAELARDLPVSVRFIELMPLGTAARLPREAFLPAAAVLEALPELRFSGQDGVAKLYSAPGWQGTVGLIAPMSCAFCAGCSRIRLTSDGRLRTCLFSSEETALRGLHGPELEQAILNAVRNKPAQHRLCAEPLSGTGRAMHEIGG